MRFSSDFIDSLERRVCLSAASIAPFSGAVTVPGFLNDYSDSFAAVKATPDGKIVAVGKIQVQADSLPQWVVFEFNSDGSLNTSFGVNGQAPNPFSGASVATTVQIENDLNDSGYTILVGGTDTLIDAKSARLDDSNVALARYTSNGQLDTSFNSTGMVTGDLGSLTDNLDSVLVDSDQTILVAGTTKVGRNNEIAVAKFNADGTPYANSSSPFGANGIEIYSFDRGSTAAVIRAVPDGAGADNGFYLFGYGTNIFVARCEQSGALDPTFGSALKSGSRSGFTKLTHIPGGANTLIGIDATNPTGLELALTSASPAGISRVAIEKLTNTGTPDATIGRKNGQVIAPGHYPDRAAPHGAIFIDSSTIFTFGYSYLLTLNQKSTNLVYEQFTVADGKLAADPSFNSDHAIEETVSGNTRFNSVTDEPGIGLDGQDAYLFAGDLNIPKSKTVKAHHVLALYRIYADGQTDPTFVG